MKTGFAKIVNGKATHTLISGTVKATIAKKAKATKVPQCVLINDALTKAFGKTTPTRKRA